MKTRFTYNFIEKAIIGSKAAIERANKGKIMMPERVARSFTDYLDKIRGMY